ncbi:cytochrome c oxidase subunit II [Phormidium tenue FACHB-886]|nr:cytochrome c oxidase subunit II [Phormidium tenue FACHB-886]
MKLRAILTLAVMAVLLALFSFWMAKESYNWFPPQASAESRMLDDLFAIFTGLGTFILLGVTIPVIYSLIFHRAGKYDYSDGPPIEGNTILEIVWTAVPILLVAGLVTASYNTYVRMNLRGPMELVHLHMPELVESAYAEPILKPDERILDQAKPVAGDKIDASPATYIDVTAKQWAWIFRYPDQDITSTELHLPVDRRVHLTLRSEDVLHGFYVPAFRVKQDVVPNHTIDFEFTPIRTGTYRLRDSMFSGTYFAANQADVVVQSLADYQQWLADAAAQTPSPAFNQAASEYNRSTNTMVHGWASIPPAPPPVVNYAPKQEPVSPPA